jgi:hypothetical protein
MDVRIDREATPPRVSRGRGGRQRGGAALVLVLVLCAAAMLIGALAIRGTVSDVRVAGATRASKTAFYCAEAGLSAARAYFANNYTGWNAMFDPTALKPPGYPFTGDVDGDNVPDYSVTLRDNVDEFPPQVNNPLRDNDLTAVMVSVCTNPAMGPRTLNQIVMINNRGTDYRTQLGHGSHHAGNEN